MWPVFNVCARNFTGSPRLSCKIPHGLYRNYSNSWCNYSVHIWGCASANDVTTSEKRFRKDREGNSRGRITGTILTFAWILKNLENLSQDSWCFCWDSKRGPSAHEPEALPLELSSRSFTPTWSCTLSLASCTNGVLRFRSFLYSQRQVIGSHCDNGSFFLDL
jgi:hypothetical protein